MVNTGSPQGGGGGCLFPCDKFVFMCSDILCRKRKAFEKPLWYLKGTNGGRSFEIFCREQEKSERKKEP